MVNRFIERLSPFILITFFCFAGVNIYAQKTIADTGYYTSYPNKLALRIYISKRPSAFILPGSSIGNLRYEPNAKLTLGAGASYKNLTLNLSYGFGFLNPENGKGKTRTYDLSGHIFPRDWVADYLIQYNKGYHLPGEFFTSANTENYYYRPDMRSILLGGGLYRLSNGEQFSYRAAAVQSEWQRKSAGSFLYGGEMVYGSVYGDSSLVPLQLKDSYSQTNIDRISFFRVAPGAGYAYTGVLDDHYFITGSLIANVGINFTSERFTENAERKTSINPSLNYKLAAGYNSDTWSLSAFYMGNTIWSKGTTDNKSYTWPSGNYRIILTKKIFPGKKVAKTFNDINDISIEDVID